MRCWRQRRRCHSPFTHNARWTAFCRYGDFVSICPNTAWQYSAKLASASIRSATKPTDMRAAICLLLIWGSVPAAAQDLIAYINGPAVDPARYRLDEVTHVIYCFGHLQGEHITFSRADSTAIRRLVDKKTRFPRLKVLLCFGGWEGCPTCAMVFATPPGRQHFAHSVVRLLYDFHADGIDIDWEFPGSRDDFTALMRTLHDSLPHDKELTFVAAGFSPWLQQAYDWKKLAPLATWINLMTYDLIGSRSPITGNHAALYASGPQTESADHAVTYLDSMGVPLSKIAIGAGFYAREWVDVPGNNHGLFQPGRFRRFIPYGRLRRLPGFTQYWDSTAQAAYSYNSAKKIFLSYDDERSLRAKARYVRHRRLAGILFWNLNLDTPGDGLLDLLYRALHSAR